MLSSLFIKQRQFESFKNYFPIHNFLVIRFELPGPMAWRFGLRALLGDRTGPRPVFIFRPFKFIFCQISIMFWHFFVRFQWYFDNLCSIWCDFRNLFFVTKKLSGLTWRRSVSEIVTMIWIRNAPAVLQHDKFQNIF